MNLLTLRFIFVAILAFASRSACGDDAVIQSEVANPLATVGKLDLQQHFETLYRQHKATTDTPEDIPRISIQGVFRDKDDRPVTDAVVLLIDDVNDVYQAALEKNQYKYDAVGTIDVVLAALRTDAKGQYEFTVPLPERWRGPVKKSRLGYLPRPSMTWNLIASSGDVFGRSTFVVESDDVEFSAGDTVKGPWCVNGETDLEVESVQNISGNYQTDEADPIAGASVKLFSLRKANARSQRLVFNLTNLAPPFRTDDQGRFSIQGLPSGTLVELRLQGTGYQPSVVEVLTGDLSGGIERRPRIRESVKESPVTIIADSGVRIFGVVTDHLGSPISGAKVRFTTGTAETKTGDDGKYEFFVSTDFRDGTIDFPNPSDLVAWVIRDNAMVRKQRTITWDRTTKSVQQDIQIDATVRVRGRVMDAKGKPIKGGFVRTVDEAAYTAGTDNEGRFTLHLRPGKHRIIVGGEDSTLDWPSLSRMRSVRNADDAAEFPGVELQTDDLDPIDLDDIVVPARKAQTIQILLPDGRPAAGSTARIRQPKGRYEVDSIDGNIFETTGAAIIAKSDGTLDIDRDPSWKNGTRLDVEARVGDQVFLAQIPVTALASQPAGNESFTYTLQPACLLVGKVLLDAKPLPGARLLISEFPGTRPIREGGGVVYQVMVGDRIWLQTDASGSFSLIVPRGGRYSADSLNLPKSFTAWSSRSVVSSSRDRSEFESFRLYSGEAEIVGRLVDQRGKPLSGFRVTLDDEGVDNGVKSDQFVGHSDSSDFRTNQDGRFALRKLLEGKYTLSISPPPNEYPSLGTWKRKGISTGDKAIEVKIEVNRPFGLPPNR
ncbi:MAG: hypothetical protein AAF958_00430 [Planctomycetota bacterium]